MQGRNPKYSDSNMLATSVVNKTNYCAASHLCQSVHTESVDRKRRPSVNDLVRFVYSGSRQNICVGTVSGSDLGVTRPKCKKRKTEKDKDTEV